jgi:predicted dinucleotide-binding enzyme
MKCEGCRDRGCVIADLTDEAKQLRAELAAERQKRKDAESDCSKELKHQDKIKHELRQEAKSLAAENVRLREALKSAHHDMVIFAVPFEYCLDVEHAINSTPETAKVQAVIKAAKRQKEIHDEYHCDPTEPEWKCGICRAVCAMK